MYETRLHADHASGPRILAPETGATLYLNPADRFDFAYTALAEGDCDKIMVLGDDVVVLPTYYGDATKVRPGGAAADLGDRWATLSPLQLDEYHVATWARSTTTRPPTRRSSEQT